jgi:ATP-dependent RNA helicase DDX24/MAK5
MDGTKKKRRKSAEQATADAKASSSKKRSHSKSSQFWNAMKGWKPVEIDDDFLLGAEEGGFAGLEVLEDYTLIEPPGGKRKAWRLAAMCFL